MLYTPLVIKQIKHSSNSLYQQLRHTPLKLAILIIIQTVNIAYLESLVLQIIVFFFALSFGFVRFYKENLFKGESSSEQYYVLQETRRICYWSYKQMLKAQFKLKLCSASNTKQMQLKEEFTKFQTLHIQMLHHENQLCKKLKHKNVENYLDELMK